MNKTDLMSNATLYIVEAFCHNCDNRRYDFFEPPCVDCKVEYTVSNYSDILNPK